MENIAKISFVISFAVFAAASATLASVGGTALTSAPVKSSFLTPETEKLIPRAGSSQSARPMLLPKALDKAAADDISRRAVGSAARKAALLKLQRGVIRLR